MKPRSENDILKNTLCQHDSSVFHFGIFLRFHQCLSRNISHIKNSSRNDLLLLLSFHFSSFGGETSRIHTFSLCSFRLSISSYMVHLKKIFTRQVSDSLLDSLATRRILMQTWKNLSEKIRNHSSIVLQEIQKRQPHKINNKKTPRYGAFFIVSLDRYRSYFIPGCNEIMVSAALHDNSGSDSIGGYGIRPRKRYNL